MTVAIKDLKARVEALAAEALKSVGLPDGASLTPAPNPEMGDLGLPCFPYAKIARKAPAAIASDIASAVTSDPLIREVVATGPYVNFRYNPPELAKIVLREALERGSKFGWAPTAPDDAAPVLIEYSSPNTNKPQHLGHVRNNLLGYSVSQLTKAAGQRVVRINLVNDRGIHICKSMLAYQLFGEGKTPESEGIKGDHFVGGFYVLFETKFKEEYKAWLATQDADRAFQEWLTTKPGMGATKAQEKDPEAPSPREAFDAAYKQDYFNRESDLGGQARAMLLAWEADDEPTVALWKQMNAWVLDGFKATYKRLGVAFDRYDFESTTYLHGKRIAQEGLESGVFAHGEGGALMFDLERIGKTGQKVILRSDGTTVYITQDLGTACSRADELNPKRMHYTVADEQEYYFQVLFGVLGELRPNLKDRCHHLSYGMVLLPEGKMKSREGTVVDADDLMDEMARLARVEIDARQADAKEPVEDGELAHRAETIGLAALKYYLLNFTPKSTITFDPAKSIDFLGQTGPYCLYAYARVQSLLRKAALDVPSAEEMAEIGGVLTSSLEQGVVRELMTFPATVEFAAAHSDPSKIADHVWKIAKSFAALYNDKNHQIVGHSDTVVRRARLGLASAVAVSIASGLSLLGIDTLDRM